VLVAASRRAGLLDGVLRLAAPAPLTATVLRLTGLDSRFEIFATVPEALAHPLTPGVRDADVPKPPAGWSAQPATGELHGTAAAGGRGPCQLVPRPVTLPGFR
jgi:hypothetical protein